MQCLSCQKEIPLTLGFVTQPYRYCKKCFLYHIERRVRNSIREHHPLKKGQRVVVSDAVARYFLEQVVHIPLTLVKAGFSTGVFTSGFAESFRSQWKITRKLEDRPERSEHTIRSLTDGGRSSVDKSMKRTDLAVSSATQDDRVVSFLEHILFGKKMLKQKRNIFYLFASLTDEELALYCHYRRLLFVPAKNALKERLHDLEQRHPGTMHALAKSMKDLHALKNY